MIDAQKLYKFVEQQWDREVLPSLMEYIKIPAKSPNFDKEWQKNGYIDQAIQHVADWCYQHAPQGMLLEVMQLPGRTPLLFIEVPGAIDRTVLLYGHLDKQPEFVGWKSGLGPWKPVLQDNKLYGRGASDDGYAAYAAILAISALQAQNVPHPRCVFIIETCEESGSEDLPYYLTALSDRVGTPFLVIGLDSGAGNYEQLWMTTSLRGCVNLELTVELLQEGVHSGLASGIVADSFRVIRALLSRVEDEKTGEILLDALHCDIPSARQVQAALCASILGKSIYQGLPFYPKVLPMSSNLEQLLINSTWKPTLTVVGADGLPYIADAGNVARTKTALKLSFRLPPLVCAEEAITVLKKTLTQDPPYRAKVTCELSSSAPGWHSPLLQPWLAQAVDEASTLFYQKPVAYMGEGGTIPFMGMLGEKFPDTQFVITGVLGPHSNAHGPNEFLHLEMVKKLTSCISYIIALVR